MLGIAGEFKVSGSFVPHQADCQTTGKSEGKADSLCNARGFAEKVPCQHQCHDGADGTNDGELLRSRSAQADAKQVGRQDRADNGHQDRPSVDAAALVKQGGDGTRNRVVRQDHDAGDATDDGRESIGTHASHDGEAQQNECSVGQRTAKDQGHAQEQLVQVFAASMGLANEGDEDA